MMTFGCSPVNDYITTTISQAKYLLWRDSVKNEIQNTWVASLGICLDKFAANRAVNMFHGRSPPAVSHNMAAENVQSETRM